MSHSGHKITLGIEEIKKILPHRYPFLFVDRVLEMDERNIVGIKNVTINEPFFQGHFPAKPVMPGVLMVEALAQLGGILMLSRPENKGKLAYLASINQAKFRRIVVPGEQLLLKVELLKMKSKVGMMKGVAEVSGEPTCEAEILFSTD